MKVSVGRAGGVLTFLHGPQTCCYWFLHFTIQEPQNLRMYVDRKRGSLNVRSGQLGFAADILECIYLCSVPTERFFQFRSSTCRENEPENVEDILKF